MTPAASTAAERSATTTSARSSSSRATSSRRSGRSQTVPRGQHNIVDTVPGQGDYTPLWQVNKVTFKSGVTPHLLRVKSRRRSRTAGRRSDRHRHQRPSSTAPCSASARSALPDSPPARRSTTTTSARSRSRPATRFCRSSRSRNGVAGQHNITEETIAPGRHRLPAALGDRQGEVDRLRPQASPHQL